jgi:hypothetical protein
MAKEIRGGGAPYARYRFLVADYKPEFYLWDTLEMLRKAVITGFIMFVSRGSLFHLVVALMFSICSSLAVAWYQPYASPKANIFKVGAEASLSITLALAAILRVDLSREDVSDGFIGFLMMIRTVSTLICDPTH